METIQGTNKLNASKYKILFDHNGDIALFIESTGAYTVTGYVDFKGRFVAQIDWNGGFIPSFIGQGLGDALAGLAWSIHEAKCPAPAWKLSATLLDLINKSSSSSAKPERPGLAASEVTEVKETLALITEGLEKLVAQQSTLAIRLNQLEADSDPWAGNTEQDLDGDGLSPWQAAKFVAAAEQGQVRP